MKFRIRIDDKLIHRTDNLKEALKVVAELFRKGHTEVFLDGGKLGKWR